MKNFLLIIAVLLALATVSIANRRPYAGQPGYNQGYNQGYNMGHNMGYNMGYNQGYPNVQSVPPGAYGSSPYNAQPGAQGGKPQPKHNQAGRGYYGFRNPRTHG